MRTIVIGGGIAGLWIANKLARQGDEVTVLEKYDYIGGRVLTSKYGYELGAGRVSTTHKRVMALIRQFHLHTAPIPAKGNWMPLNSKSNGEPSTFEPTWAAVLSLIRDLDATTLATNTLRDLAEQVLGKAQADALLEQYPYRAETESLRADLAIKAFENEMGSYEGFLHVKGGLSAIIQGLAAEFEKVGGTIRMSSPVRNVTGTDGRFLVHIGPDNTLLGADRVIFALHATALKEIPVTRGLPALRHLDMAPLIRIYAEIPGLQLKQRIVTDSPLRFIIPIHGDVVMISYTDGRDTKVWAGLEGDALTATVHREVVRLFGSVNVKKPTWVRKALWSEGTTYWKPGHYDPYKASTDALELRPGLYCCGESFSPTHQAWMEGALEHAEALLAHLTGKPVA